MTAPYKETHFEQAIVKRMVDDGGWVEGNRESYGRTLGFDWVELRAFIRETQLEKWQDFVATRYSGDEARAEAGFCQAVAAMLDSGALSSIRHGITVEGMDFDLAYFRPEHALTPELVARYDANRLTVVRQLRYSDADTNTLDVTLMLNGIPLVTAELKNELTGQTVEHAKRQYREDRDPKERIFAKRAVVHFAVDTDEVYLTTKLAGEDTTFLPFNRGHNGRPGNPPKGKYPASYLWEEVWQRDNFLDLIRRFIHLERANGDTRVVFPRYHQWDAVRRMIADARGNGPGRNYLAQHSAGSGKSNTIGWLSHRLAVLHDAADKPVFDKVVVVTDRVVLDRQLQDTIHQFEHQTGLVEKVEGTSAQLAKALESSTAKIIITTLQKFPFVLEKVGDLSDLNFAVIIDEAHSSQGGEAAKDLKKALGAAGKAVKEAKKKAGETHEAEEELSADEIQELITAEVAARGRQKNLSFFAFTATPTRQTLEIFGSEGPGGKRVPFHLYPMRQAIEEGFILDVLEHYTPYEVLWKLASKTGKSEEVEKGKATAAALRFVAAHPKTLEEKAKIIVEHFHETTRFKVAGRAKAMVVTASRAQAVRTYFAIKKVAEDLGYPECRPLIAFSDSVHVDGADYTEAQLNGFGEKQLPEEFAKPENRILVVAEKYQTGFDQPLLQTMYVDKKLGGLRAVQTLSRLNRIHPDKEDTFVLDFVNDPEDIREAFEPYYEATMAKPTSPTELYVAHRNLKDYGVLDEANERQFSAVFLSRDDPEAHVELVAEVRPALERFDNLDEDRQEEFRLALAKFLDLYGYMAQAVAFNDERLEATYLYGKHLQRALPQDLSGGLDLSGELVLTHLRIEAGEEAKATPDEGGDAFAADTAEVFDPVEPARDSLSEIINKLNDRFGSELGSSDRVVLEQVLEEMAEDPDLIQKAQVNSKENFLMSFKAPFEEEVLKAESSNRSLFERFFSDPQFQEAVIKGMGDEFHRRHAETAV